ncbi:MAG: hypothetical protein WA118_13505 [Carboxydocellales bacterium]
MKTLKDGRKITTVYDYDQVSRLKAVLEPKGNRTTYDYDANGNLLKETAYDKDGNVLAETEHSYDYNNQLRGTKDPEGYVTTYSLDVRGLLVEEINPLLQSTKMDYDGNGNRLWVMDANLHTTNYDYDPLNRLKKVIEPPDGTNQSVVEYFYDANGNRQAVQDAEGKSTIYEFNKFNRLEASTPIITAMTTTTLQVYIVLKYSMWLMENLCFGNGA